MSTVSLDGLLTSFLQQTLREEARKDFGITNAKQQEVDLIVAVAKETIEAHPEDFNGGITKSKLMSPGQRAEILEPLKQHLIAATSVALFIEMRELQRDAHLLTLKIKDLTKKINDPSTDKGTKELALKDVLKLKQDLRLTLKRLNSFDSNKERREKMDKILDKDDIIDKMLQMEKDLQLVKDMDSGKEPPQKIDTLDDSKNLSDTLQNLFGIDPHTPGKIPIPVLAIIGNFVGVPDSYPAPDANEPIHRLSKDFDVSGIDEHMINQFSGLAKEHGLDTVAEERLNLDNADDNLFLSANRPENTKG